VDAGDLRIGYERDRPVTGDELAEPLQRSALDVDAGGGQHHVVTVARGCVGHLGVERCAQLEPASEFGFVARQRTVTATRPEPRGLDVDR
jgi:hypothetical protein